MRILLLILLVSFSSLAQAQGGRININGGAGGSGTVNSGTANRLTYYGSTGTTVSSLSAITANRALVSDANGLPTQSTTTATQLNYLSNATGTTGTPSTNLVFSTSPTLVTPILGTPQSVTLTNGTGLPLSTGVTGTLQATNFPAISGDITINSGSLSAAITAGVIVNADINASAAIDATKLIDGSVSNTELGYINTLSSNAQTQLDNRILLPSVVVSSSTSLTLTNTGSYLKDYYYTSASDGTWTMPAIGTTGQRIFIKNEGAGDLTVQRAGSDQLFTNALVNSIILYTGDSMTFSDTGTHWSSR